MLLTIPLKKIHPLAKIPDYAHLHDGGLDLFAVEPFSLEPRERRLIRTGISLAIPPGYLGQVCPRSGLALKQGVTVLNAPGIVDSGYRGEIGVILINLGDATYENQGKAIAQLVITQVQTVQTIAVEELDVSDRNEAGFGSTDKQ